MVTVVKRVPGNPEILALNPVVVVGAHFWGASY